MISTTVIEINGAAFFYFMCRSTWNEMVPFQHALLLISYCQRHVPFLFQDETNVECFRIVTSSTF